MGSNLQKSRFSKIRKILDIGVFYMSSISAMGPHFFHWKNKLWVRGGRSRLALSENINKYFFSAVYDRFMPSKPANLRAPYKIRFSILLKNQKMLLILWYGVAASSFFPRFSVFKMFPDQIFFDFYLFGHFSILRHQKIC